MNFLKKINYCLFVRNANLQFSIQNQQILYTINNTMYYTTSFFFFWKSEKIQ